MAVLTPTYSLTLGDQLWTEQALEIGLRLDAAPLLDVLTVRLPSEARPSAGLGDPVELEVDGGEGGERVFVGSIAGLRRDVTELIVTALDGGGALAAYRPATTYEQVTAGTLIKTLCGELGIATADVEDGPTLAFYAADPGRSALEHVARLAGWCGALARFTEDGELVSTVVGTSPDLALRYGRELLAFQGAQLTAPIESFVVVGEAGAGDASELEALRPTSDFFAGSRPEGPSPTALWRFEPALRTASAAGTASAALLRQYGSSRRPARLHATLLPALRPGAVLEIQDLPDDLQGGPFWADRVEHRLGNTGATTSARLQEAGEEFDPMSLLGSLAGAVGALL